MNKKINEFRKSKGLTVEEFAKELKYSSSAVIKFVYGERDLSGQFLRRLKSVYPDIDMNWVFEGENNDKHKFA